MESDGNRSRIECDDASCIAELCHREKGRRSEGRDNVDAACRERETGQVEFGFVCGIHYRAVGIGDADRIGGRSFINDGCRNGAEMRSTTAVCDGDSIWWYYVWRGGNLLDY